VVERLFAAFNRHDRASMQALYAPDAVHLSPDLCAPAQGPVAIAAIYQTLFDTLPDMRDDLEEMVAEGDHVALRFTAHAHANGQALDMPIAAFIEVRDGRIVREQTFYDTHRRPCA
jgi:steroid delta-isomerase-like uncharacterized protein